MSEKPSPMYTRENHPHTGDPRVDPLARLIRKVQRRHQQLAAPQTKIPGAETEQFFDEASFVDQSALTQKPNLENKKVNSSYKIEYKPNPNIPVNYVWVTGEFFTGPLGSEVGEFAGKLKGRVKIVSVGKKLSIKGYNGIGNINGKIIEVVDPKDRQFLGRSGWWNKANLSHETPKRRRTRKLTS